MQRTVIIIDDDRDDLDVMEETLRQIDPATIILAFPYPEEALNLLTKDMIIVPDFIFIDINMPKITGVQCLAHLRTIKEFNHVPIVIYSTTITESVCESLVKDGATYVMQKPPNFHDYQTVLEDILLNTGLKNKYLKAVPTSSYT
jgi:CheY-like chemotaxis protein